MRILIITHDILTYKNSKKKMRWTRFPKLFQELGHNISYIRKYYWWTYPLRYLIFRPEVVISVGKTAGLITAVHHMIPFRRNALFVHDLTDFYKIYKSDERLHFLSKNHDLVTSPSWHNFKKFNCNEFIMNGCDYKPGKAEIKYDACYQGAQNDFYNLKKLEEDCKNEGISFHNIKGLSSEETEKAMYECKICVYPLSWDCSLKTTDYAAIEKPVVAIKPNLLEDIGYPAYYTENLAKGIKHLLDNPGIAQDLGKNLRGWFLSRSGSWMDQAKKYLTAVEKHVRNRRSQL